MYHSSSFLLFTMTNTSTTYLLAWTKNHIVVPTLPSALSNHVILRHFLRTGNVSTGTSHKSKKSSATLMPPAPIFKLPSSSSILENSFSPETPSLNDSFDISLLFDSHFLDFCADMERLDNLDQQTYLLVCKN